MDEYLPVMLILGWVAMDTLWGVVKASLLEDVLGLDGVTRFLLLSTRAEACLPVLLLLFWPLPLEAGTGNLDMLDVLLLEPEVNMLDVLLPDVAVVAADNLFGGFLDIIFSTGKILITVLRYFMSEV